jgi:hypothetical protein
MIDLQHYRTSVANALPQRKSSPKKNNVAGAYLLYAPATLLT